MTRSARSAGPRWNRGRKAPTFPHTNLLNVHRQNAGKTSHPKRPRDPNQLAKSIIDIALDRKTRAQSFTSFARANRSALDSSLTFTHDLESRLANRVQLISDGRAPYLQAVDSAFSDHVDSAMLIKLYGADHQAEVPLQPGKVHRRKNKKEGGYRQPRQ